MTSLPYRPSPGAHRAPHRPLRLTYRGRIVRDMIAGTLVLLLAVFSQPISAGYFSAVLWVGRLTGATA